MINALILSKDRACQLRLLFDSIKKYAPKLFNQITVIYTGSDDRFIQGYDKLISQEVLPNLVWQKEKDFVQDFVNFFEQCDSEFSCGIVDDCVFYKTVPSDAELVESAFDDDVFCFSLRLGSNTTMQYYMRPEERHHLQNHMVSSHFVKWDWKEWDSRLNYGYPISLDGHIFRTKELAELNRKHEFQYLRQWEGVLAGNSRKDVDRNMMVSYRQSVLFSIPANCVQDPPLVSGQIHSFSEEVLNDSYLGGNIIDLDKLEVGFQNVQWCHNEVPFVFKVDDLIQQEQE